MKTKFVSIDPGLGGTGVAVLIFDDIDQSYELLCAHSFARKNAESYMTAIEEWICDEGHNDAEFVAIEEPSLMGGQKGSASARSGSLIKLTLFAGALSGKFFGIGISTRFVPVNQWKGSLPKEITTARILEALPFLPRDKASHYYDAIGIGLHIIEQLAQEIEDG